MRRAALQSLCLALLYAHDTYASLGDRLPDFKACVADCTTANCVPDGPPIPLHRRLLRWTCPSECDYTCQHITTSTRLARDPPYRQPVLQFHGKWPFHRFLGMQEPFSVLFSLLNYLAHSWGLAQVRSHIPAAYPLRPWYLAFGYCGLATWALSCLFHTRDTKLTERLDYFAAALSIFYGLYLAAVRIFRLDEYETDRIKGTLLRMWTLLMAALYVAHVSYLSFWAFDYGYNMAANVAVGVGSNLLWTWFSIERYRRMRQFWAIWPSLIVAWVTLAMSLELFDFPPWGGMIDAHSLWHLGTVGPTIWWYNFLIKDAGEDVQGTRLKA